MSREDPGPAVMSTRPWMFEVRVGDLLEPEPLWNKSNGAPSRRLPASVRVLAVVPTADDGRRGSQSGVMYTVRDVGGRAVTLDAAWFKGFKTKERAA